jgi:endonuclease/exonuclease/phosphatase (EEP) superfamily protein YafD
MKEAQLTGITTQPHAWWERLLIAFSHFYLLIIVGGLGLHLLAGRDWWWTFILSSTSVVLFAPLPLVFLAAWRVRRKEIWLGLGLAVGLWLYFYGGLFLPKIQTVEANDNILRVTSYNTLGTNPDTAGMLAVIRQTNADLIAIQELGPAQAAAVMSELADLYPYQELRPEEGVTGMGIISRYPMQALPYQSKARYWLGDPQLAQLDFDGRAVTLFNYHAVPPTLGVGRPADLPRATRLAIEIREEQAREIAALTDSHPGPLLVLGDLNVNDQSRVYRIATANLRDAWRDAGWGYGNSFHGILGLAFARIDYIFYSDHWQAISAEMGRDGGSDHLPITADLCLVE